VTNNARNEKKAGTEATEKGIGREKAPKAEGTKTRVAVVDDHPIVRQGLAELINCQDDMEFCCEAADAASAIEAIYAARPDVAVIDLSLKESNGIDLIKDLKQRMPELRVLVLSMYDEFLYAERVLRAGARGYVTKNEASENVISAIRKVVAGQIYLSPQMASKMLAKFVDGPDVGDTRLQDRLTDRELQIFSLFGQGMTRGQIAEQLHISVKTVESHRENLKRKLNLDTATELLQHAICWVQMQ